MKKSLLALAVVCAYAGNASADGTSINFTPASSLTFYGSFDAAVASVNSQVQSPTVSGTNKYFASGNLSGNRLGFDGQTDLGDGTKGVIKLETGFNTANGASSSSSSFFNRSAYAGFSNANAGTILFGRQYTPYYLYVGAISSTTLISGATGAHPGDIDDLDVSLRNNSAITYSTPEFSGAQVSTMFAFGGNAGNMNAGQTSSIAMKYNVDALKFALGYQRLNSGITSIYDATSSSGGLIGATAINGGYKTATNTQMIAGGMRYTMNNFMVGLSASSVSYEAGALSSFKQTEKYTSTGVFGSYNPTPAIMLGAGLSYTSANNANGIANAAKYSQLSLAQTYDWSKNITLYMLEGYQRASGQTLSTDGKTIINTVAVVGDSQSSTPSAGRMQDVFMIGMRYKF